MRGMMIFLSIAIVVVILWVIGEIDRAMLISVLLHLLPFVVLVAVLLWILSKKKKKLDIPFSKAHTATLAALKDLELPVEKDTKVGLKAKIKSRFPGGTRVQIVIRAVTESSSKIMVQISPFDMERNIRRGLKDIFEAIHQRL